MRSKTVLLFSLLAGLAQPSLAGPQLPTGGMVVAGNATISTSTTRVDVVQTTNRSIINWGSFSVGSGGTVQFVQPSSTSAVLNRVTGAGNSTILGTISANGQVFLLNPSGIVVGPGGRIEAASLVLTTAAIADGEFMAGTVSLASPPGGETVSVEPGIPDPGSSTASIGVPGGLITGTVPVVLSTTVLSTTTLPLNIVATGGTLHTGATAGFAGQTISSGNIPQTQGGSLVVRTSGIAPSASAPPSGSRVTLSGSPSTPAPSAASTHAIVDGAVTIRIPLVAAEPAIFN
ncbi:MAG: filamentous hemagglutinin N-terminal domain-containing protein [Betaproteobacteria bacterium]|nr:filamentous hemagglutinin N-terminal domain-containing protein [Betaproteobacteria bacterium]